MVSEMPLPTPDILRQLLRYEPETGKLFWRERPAAMFALGDHRSRIWNTKHSGTEAFTTRGGYFRGAIFNRKYLAHRVIWAMEYDEWPSDQIDHINGIRTDNRIANLRVTSNAGNHKNQKRPSDNSSGVIGVHWDRRRKKWVASIKAEGRHLSLGYFADIGGASAARKIAEQKYGFHANHGRHA